MVCVHHINQRPQHAPCEKTSNKLQNSTKKNTVHGGGKKNIKTLRSSNYEKMKRKTERNIHNPVIKENQESIIRRKTEKTGERKHPLKQLEKLANNEREK